MRIKYFSFQKLAFLMNCAGVPKGDMKVLPFSGFCQFFTPLLLPAPFPPSFPLLIFLSSLQPLSSVQPHASFSVK